MSTGRWLPGPQSWPQKRAAPLVTPNPLEIFMEGQRPKAKPVALVCRQGDCSVTEASRGPIPADFADPSGAQRLCQPPCAHERHPLPT